MNIKASRWYLQQLKTGNAAFVAYLLILTGFWTIYNQLFITVPLFIRDFVDTKDLVLAITELAPSWLDYLAAVNHSQLTVLLPDLAQAYQQESQSMQQLAQQLIVERVPTAIRAVGRQQRTTHDVKVAHGIQDFVLGKLVGVAQAVGVEHFHIVQHNGIVESAAQG